LLALDAIETLLQQHPNKVVLIDEAYIDFGAILTRKVPLL